MEDVIRRRRLEGAGRPGHPRRCCAARRSAPAKVTLGSRPANASSGFQPARSTDTASSSAVATRARQARAALYDWGDAREGEDLRPDPARGRATSPSSSGAWAIGMIFFRREPAPRRRRDARPRSRPRYRRRCEVAGVFVNAPLDDVLATLGSVPLTMLQFHGDEGPSYCAEAARRSGLKVMKAVRAKDAHAVKALSAYKTDLHMLDAYVPGHLRRHRRALRLGAGRRASGRPPLVLSGGLTAGERGRGPGRRAARSPSTSRAASRPRPGVKDPDKLRRFFEAVEQAAAHPALMATERRAALRPLRRPLRPRDADAGARASSSASGWRRATIPASARGSTGCWPPTWAGPTPLYHAERLSERVGVARLPEARGPAPHRRAQDQQRAGPGAAGPADGQATRDRGDRRGAARGCDRDRLRAAGPRVRRLHGHRGHAPPASQRGAHGPPGRDGRAGRGRRAHAQGGGQRRDPRLGHERRDDALHHRLRGRARRRTRRSCATCSA